MVAYRVQVTLKTSDGNPSSWVTNTWACAGVDTDDCLDFIVALRAFYNAIRPYYSSYIVQNGHEIKAYNLADAEPRAPISEQVFNFTVAPSGSTMPLEVAICLSFQGVKVSGQSQARRRGRVYLGPLGITNITSDGRPATAMITGIVTAANALQDANLPSATWDWAVYSTVNGTTIDVDNGWVDNEFDTQRRRGREATSRTTFS